MRKSLKLQRAEVCTSSVALQHIGAVHEGAFSSCQVQLNHVSESLLRLTLLWPLARLDFFAFAIARLSPRLWLIAWKLCPVEANTHFECSGGSAAAAHSWKWVLLRLTLIGLNGLLNDLAGRAHWCLHGVPNALCFLRGRRELSDWHGQRGHGRHDGDVATGRRRQDFVCSHAKWVATNSACVVQR